MLGSAECYSWDTLRKHLKRGKLDCALRMERQASESTIELNRPLLLQVLGMVEQVRRDAPEIGSPNPMELLRWPGVIRQSDIDVEPLFEAAAALLDTTVVTFRETRTREGERIAEMIETRCKDIEALVAAVRERMPQVLEAARAKQQERIDALDVEADPARLEVELALIAQKLDVDEELDRLDSHITEIREVLDNDEAHGGDTVAPTQLVQFLE